MMGLIEPDQLKQGYDKKKSGVNGEKSGSSRPQVGPKSEGCRGSENGVNPSNGKALKDVDEDEAENGLIRVKNSSASNHSHNPALVAQGVE